MPIINTFYCGLHTLHANVVELFEIHPSNLNYILWSSTEKCFARHDRNGLWDKKKEKKMILTNYTHTTKIIY